MRTSYLGTCVIASLVVGGVWSGVMAQGGAAQQPPPARVMLIFTQVKLGMGADYRKLQQAEVVPALKKAGLPWRWVYASGPLSGGGGTFVSAQPIANFAQFDGGQSPLQRGLGAGFAQYAAKVQPMVVSQRQVVQTLVQDASLQSFSSTPPPLIRVTDFVLVPGKGGDFATLTREQYLPAAKKAGVTDYLVFVTNYGGLINSRSTVEYLSKFADLDAGNPVARAMGPEAFQKFNQQRAALITSNESAVFSFVPEASYGAPAPPK